MHYPRAAHGVMDYRLRKQFDLKHTFVANAADYPSNAGLTWLCP
jgi:hypothetical protein